MSAEIIAAGGRAVDHCNSEEQLQTYTCRRYLEFYRFLIHINTYLKTALRSGGINGMRSSKADGNVPGGKDCIWRLKWKEILNYGGSDNVLITQAVAGCRGKLYYKYDVKVVRRQMGLL